jgi:hypothetical protein
LINLETGCLEAIVDLQIVACKNWELTSTLDGF